MEKALKAAVRSIGMQKAALKQAKLTNLMDRMSDIEKQLSKVEDWMDEIEQTIAHVRRAVASPDNGSDFDSYSPLVGDDD